jgi:hypothetical protein
LWDPVLDARQLAEAVGEFDDTPVADDAPWVFLSHSFLDIEAIRVLRRALLDRGYGVWIAETHVLDREPIIEKVQQGLEQADQFAMYASRRSLASRWVLKEGGVAVQRWRIPATIIVDATDAELVEKVRASAVAGWTPETLGAVAGLAEGDPIDPIAPTAIDELLLSIFGVKDTHAPRVVLFSEEPADLPTPEDPPWWTTLNEVFPRC